MAAELKSWKSHFCEAGCKTQELVKLFITSPHKGQLSFYLLLSSLSSTEDTSQTWQGSHFTPPLTLKPTCTDSALVHSATKKKPHCWCLCFKPDSYSKHT